MNGTLQGATTLMFHLGVYDQLLHRELGPERATALQREIMLSLAQAQAGMIREQTGIQDFDLEAIHSVIPQFMKETTGTVFELTEKTPTRFSYHVGRCVMYESSLMLGMEPHAIQARCSATATAYVDALLRELNPNARLEVHQFRQSADQPCVESIVISA